MAPLHKKRDPCAPKMAGSYWRRVNGSAVVRLARLDASTATAVFLGRVASADACHAACVARRNVSWRGCTRWTWHASAFHARAWGAMGTRAWATTCYAVVPRSNVPRVLVPHAHATSAGRFRAYLYL